MGAPFVSYLSVVGLVVEMQAIGGQCGECAQLVQLETDTRVRRGVESVFNGWERGSKLPVRTFGACPGQF